MLKKSAIYLKLICVFVCYNSKPVFGQATLTDVHQSDSLIYSLLIKELAPMGTKVLLVDTTVRNFSKVNTINGDIVKKFNSKLIYELFDNLNIENRKQINLLQGNYIELSDSIAFYNNQQESYINPNKTYLFAFSRVGYSLDRRTAIVFVKYDRMNNQEGGSSMIILEYFLNKWSIIHFSELSVY